MNAVTLNADFFNSIRPTFGGHLEGQQVVGMNAIAEAWNAWILENGDIWPNVRWLSYALATTFHETARAMQPIEEIGYGKGKIYGQPDPITHKIYYGRGLIQLTWRNNYEVQGTRLGEDLINNPDLALKPDLAADIMLNGMAHGQFTGRRLGQYFGPDPSRDNPVGARAIINGNDQAFLIAGYHKAFLAALNKGGVM